MPDALEGLTLLLGETLGGPPAPPMVIGSDIVRLATHRHLVAPLLHQVAAAGRHAVAPVLLAELEQSYRHSVASRTRALKRLEEVAALFQARGVTWCALKGPLQAEQLYSEPARRESADIDILVAPADLAHAVVTLEQGGYAARFPALPPGALPRRLALSLSREFTFIALDDPSVAIDLHRRQFDGASDLPLPVRDGGLPSPRPGPELALYLLAHGAASDWVRLRWMTDLVLLLPRLEAEGWNTLRALAMRHGLTDTAGASLLLLREVFPFLVLPGEWAEAARNREVQYRRARYHAALQGNGKNSPLDHAAVAFVANWLLCTLPSARLLLLLRAPLASATRRLIGVFSTLQ